MADQLVRRGPLAAVTLAAAVLIGSVAACGPTASPRPDASGPAVTASPPATASAAAVSPAASPSDGPVTSAAPAVTLGQPWATEPLVDVASGETFRIADLAGRPVIVETMAIWCSNCFAQQRAAYEGLAALGSTDLVYLLVDVDPNESAADLADYRDDHGFTGRYVVATQALARALVDEFGDQILNPPSTPLFTIATDGTVTLSPYGSRKSADEIVELARSIGA